MDWINGFDITHLCVYNNNDLFIIANFDDLGGTNVKERTVYITRTGIILAVTLILQKELKGIAQALLVVNNQDAR